LRYEEEKHCLAEMPEDGDNRERHSGKVAERVADKHSCRIPDNIHIIIIIYSYLKYIEKKKTKNYQTVHRKSIKEHASAQDTSDVVPFSSQMVSSELDFSPHF